MAARADLGWTATPAIKILGYMVRRVKRPGYYGAECLFELYSQTLAGAVGSSRDGQNTYRKDREGKTRKGRKEKLRAQAEERRQV